MPKFLHAALQGDEAKTSSIMESLPHNLFHASLAERVALARQRYFEEGLRPSGIVNDTVLQSWARCQRSRRDPREQIEFQCATSSRVDLALRRNRPLLQAWTEELSQLEVALAATSCAAILTDATGVLIGATGPRRPHERLMPVAHRIGVNLSEEVVGTTAPGLVIKTGKQASVLGGEHYFEGVTAMQCVAAPIRNIAGQLAGVLDISSEHMPFDFDAAAVVGVYAASIENRLLLSEAREHLVLKVQMCAPLIDTPMVGLAGIDAQGRLAWANGVALRLIGMNAAPQQSGHPAAEEIFGVGLSRLVSLPRASAAPLRLANGLTVWARCLMQAPDGHVGLLPSHSLPAVSMTRAPDNPDSDVHAALQRLPPRERESVDAPCDADSSAGSHVLQQEPTSLRESDQELITRTLQACGGNVSRTAKQLGVSRGLIYRRLKDQNLRG